MRSHAPSGCPGPRRPPSLRRGTGCPSRRGIPARPTGGRPAARTPHRREMPRWRPRPRRRGTPRRLAGPGGPARRARAAERGPGRHRERRTAGSAGVSAGARPCLELGAATGSRVSSRPPGPTVACRGRGLPQAAVRRRLRCRRARRPRRSSGGRLLPEGDRRDWDRPEARPRNARRKSRGGIRRGRRESGPATGTRRRARTPPRYRSHGPRSPRTRRWPRERTPCRSIPAQGPGRPGAPQSSASQDRDPGHERRGPEEREGLARHEPERGPHGQAEAEAEERPAAAPKRPVAFDGKSLDRGASAPGGTGPGSPPPRAGKGLRASRAAPCSSPTRGRGRCRTGRAGLGWQGRWLLPAAPRASSPPPKPCGPGRGARSRSSCLRRRPRGERRSRRRRRRSWRRERAGSCRWRGSETRVSRRDQSSARSPQSMPTHSNPAAHSSSTSTPMPQPTDRRRRGRGASPSTRRKSGAQ